MKWILLALRALRRLTVITLGAALALYLVLLAINARDKPPNQAAARYARHFAERPKIADADNGYIFMLGLSAPRNADPGSAGALRRDWILTQLAAPIFNPDGDPLSGDDGLLRRRTGEDSALSRACNTASTDCLLAIKARPDSLSMWLGRETWLLDRYQVLIRHARWQEVAPFDVMAPLPPFHIAFEGQKLHLAKAYELARSGKTAEAQEYTESDARFWLMMLTNADTLISKMIALRGAERNMLWTSMISRQLPPEQMPSVIPRPWLAPLGRPYCSMWQVMAGEWQFSERMVRQVNNGARRMEMLGEDPLAIWRERILQAVQSPLWQPQDSSNRLADAYLDIGTALDTDCVNGRDALARARAIGHRAEVAVPWYHPYNLPFNILTAVGTGDFAEYGARVADLEAMRQALLVTIEMRQRKISPARLPGALGASPQRNPFDRQPFRWNAANGTITFTGLAEDKQGWYHYPL